MLLIEDTFVQVHMPKTGGSWLSKAACSALKTRQIGHQHASIREIPKEYEHLTKIITLRDPHSWYASLWSMATSGIKLPHKSKHVAHKTFEEFIHYALDGSLAPEMPMVICRVPPEAIESFKGRPLFSAAVDWYYGKPAAIDKCIVMMDELDSFARDVLLIPTPPPFNIGPRPRDEYKRLYTPELWDLVTERDTIA